MRWLGREEPNPPFRSPSLTVNFCKTSSKPWQQTLLPRFLVRIHEHIFLAMSFLNSTFRPSSASSMFPTLLQVFSQLAHLSTPLLTFIVKLNRKIRDTGLPQYALNLPPDSALFSVVMQHYTRKLSLSKCVLIFCTGFKRSFIISPSKHICTLYSFGRVARFWVLWTHAFSASVKLLIIRWVWPR
jgi:hypothetical protein